MIGVLVDVVCVAVMITVGAILNMHSYQRGMRAERRRHERSLWVARLGELNKRADTLDINATLHRARVRDHGPQ